MRLLVCGDRNWSDRAYLNEILDAITKLWSVDVVIEGEAPGADTLSRQWAEARGIPVDPYPARWDSFGKAAGPIRNAKMLHEGKPDLVVAFHPDLSKSAGTANMVKQATRAGVGVYVFPRDEPMIDAVLTGAVV